MELLEHNQKAVDEILEKFNIGVKSIIFTAGVGVGKSFVFMGVAEQFEGRILYILPKHAITENVKSYKEFKLFEDRTDFVTYNFFNDESKYEKLNDYSLIVIDEAHHIGSDLYGKHLLKAINKHSCKVLGLTATPIRMEGDVRDVKNLFDDHVQGLTNFEAISKGLMPQIEYLVCAPEEAEISDDERIVIDLENSYDLLKEAIDTNPKDKWICFFTNIKQLHKSKPLIKKLFPDHTVLEIHSKRKDCKEILRKANEEYDKCVMLNCDMLLEGLHFSGVNGLIIFREVHSIPVFEQIIGRVSSIGKKENPLVIDCTETWMRMDNYIEEPKEKTIIETGGNGVELVPKKPCFVSLKNKKYYDYMKLLQRRHESTSGKFVYDDIEYPNFKACCDALGINYKKIFKVGDYYNITDKYELIEKYFQLYEGYIFKGKRYRNFTEACKEYGFIGSRVAYNARRNGISQDEMLERYISKGLVTREEVIYKGKTYKSYKSICDELGISYAAANANRKKTGDDWLTVITRLDSMPRSKNEFIFQGKVFKSFSEACRFYEKRESTVSKFILTKNFTKEQALEYAIKNDFANLKKIV